MRYSEDVKKAVLKDYAESDMTVLQIAEKYHVKPRIIYHWTQSGRATRRRLDYERINFRFTKKEVDVMLCALFDYIGSASGTRAAIAESLRERLINKTE